jgi:hypothetical protein
MAIQFENCPVLFKPRFPTNGFSGAFVLANSAEINDSISLSEIRELGREGSNRARAESPVQGSISVDFIYGDLNIKVNGQNYSAPRKEWFDNLTGTIEYVDVEVGPYAFKSGLLTNFSFSSEPNSAVNASAEFIFYNAELSKGSLPNAYDPSFIGEGHGVYSSGDFSDSSIGMNNHPFSFSYVLTQNFEASRYIGEITPALVRRTDGQIAVEIEGDDLGTALTASPDNLCKSKITEASFNISGLCTPSFGDQYTVGGYVESRSISVAEGDIVRGNISIVDYF